MVVTNMGVMRFDDLTREMYLSRYYPGITPEAILEKMAFSVDISRAREETPPSERELSLLREKCDPQRLIL
jgi:glutaconate CoA-transferase subunit B